jgi:hypothetical protein
MPTNVGGLGVVPYKIEEPNPNLGWVGDPLIEGGLARLTYPIVHVGG